MWWTTDSLFSIRQAAALLEGRDPTDPRSRQIAGVIAFAREMVHRAKRVEVFTRYRFPSVTAANEGEDRWVEFLAFEEGGGYRLEFWKQRTDLDRPPTPERIQDFTEEDFDKRRPLATYNSESWLCRAESWRWIDMPV